MEIGVASRYPAVATVVVVPRRGPALLKLDCRPTPAAGDRRSTMWRIAAMAVLLNGTLVNPDTLTSADTHASGDAATVEITDPVTQKVLGVLPVADRP